MDNVQWKNSPNSSPSTLGTMAMVGDEYCELFVGAVPESSFWILFNRGLSCSTEAAVDNWSVEVSSIFGLSARERIDIVILLGFKKDFEESLDFEEGIDS